MPRAIDWEETVDTSTFSAVQLQPGTVASLTWNAMARWLRTYLVSFPTLIAKESTGLVVMGFHLDYRDPISFYDCEAFRVRGAFRMMRRGERGQLSFGSLNFGFALDLVLRTQPGAEFNNRLQGTGLQGSLRLHISAKPTRPTDPRT